MECSISNTENEPSMKKITLKKSIAMRKLQLLSKCVESMTQPSPDEKSYIEEKLSRLSKRHKGWLSKKRIMDVVFEIEMSTFNENEREVLVFPSGAVALMLMPTQNPKLFYYNNRSSTQYIDMMLSN